MWRLVAGIFGVLMLSIAAMLWWKSSARADNSIAPPPSISPLLAQHPLTMPPAASEQTREQKRFDRYDKDRNGIVSRDEYLASRRKAFVKLDRDGDGRLGFEEWSAKTMAKFAGADGDRSVSLNRAEFAMTKAVRKPAARCGCGERE